VFLHGAGGSIQTWKKEEASLALSYNLLLIDLRDHGDSKDISPSFKRYSFDIIVNDLIDVFEKLDIQQADFVTLSFGSVLLQALHQRHPHFVNRMILIGGIFNGNWQIKAFVHFARFLNLFLAYKTMYRVFSYLLMPKENHQVARRVYQQQARKLTQAEYLKWLGLYSEFFLLLSRFQKQSISQRILIIMGDEDFLFLPAAKRFSAQRPNAELQIVSKAGHICNIEKPGEVNRIILGFLSNQKASGQISATKAPSYTS